MAIIKSGYNGELRGESPRNVTSMTDNHPCPSPVSSDVSSDVSDMLPTTCEEYFKYDVECMDTYMEAYGGLNGDEDIFSDIDDIDDDEIVYAPSRKLPSKRCLKDVNDACAARKFPRSLFPTPNIVIDLTNIPDDLPIVSNCMIHFDLTDDDHPIVTTIPKKRKRFVPINVNPPPVVVCSDDDFDDSGTEERSVDGSDDSSMGSFVDYRDDDEITVDSDDDNSNF